jgi:hypothetical protein
MVSDVYHACNASVTAATDALLSMQLTSPEEERQLSPLTTTTSPSLWGMLPEEIKQLIFMSLGSLEAVAKAAPVCTEFATHARLVYSLKHTLTLPKKKLSPAAIAGMVAAFPNASVVNASPLASMYCRFPVDFEDLIAAIAVGEAARKKKKKKTIGASNNNSNSNSNDNNIVGAPTYLLGSNINNDSGNNGNFKVNVLNMSRCETLEDGDVFMMCSMLKHLTGLDLSGCTRLTDVALKTLSMYNREEEEEEENDGDGDGSLNLQNNAITDDGDINNNNNNNNKTFEMPRAAVGTLLDKLIKEKIDRFIKKDDDGEYQAYMHSISGTNSATTSGTTSGTRFNRGLMYLNLRYCSSMTDKGLDHIMKSTGSMCSKSLRYLDISHSPKVLDHMLELHHNKSVLKTLCAQSCSQLVGVHIDLPSSSSSSITTTTLLQNLYLQNCTSLVEVMITCHSLEALNVSGCKKLVFLSLDCRNLKTVIASNCRLLTLRSAAPAAAGGGGEWLGPGTVAIRCPALYHLNLFGCREVESETLDVIVPHLTKLKHINVAGCVKISRLLLDQCHQLEEVDVSGCHTLARVLVASPEIQRFRGKGCVRMHQLKFQGGVLPGREVDVENCEVLREVMVTREVGGREEREEKRERCGSGQRRVVNSVGCRNLNERSKELLLGK